MNQINSGINRTLLSRDSKLNIISFSCHERSDSKIAKTGHNFIYLEAQGLKTWDKTYAPVPNNITILNIDPNNPKLPLSTTPNLVLCQNIFAHYNQCKQLSVQYGIPIINLYHTFSYPHVWKQDTWDKINQMVGNTNVFITDTNRKGWRFDETNSVVIEHSIDTNLFFKKEGIEKKKEIIWVGNAALERRFEIGTDLMLEFKKNLPIKIVGKSPGLSEPASSVEELCQFYNESLVFLSTASHSPIPTVLIEAMACGVAPVTVENDMIKTLIKNGENGFITNDKEQLRKSLEYLLLNPDKAREMGENARQTVLKRFSMDRFVHQWNEVFYETARLNPLIPHPHFRFKNEA